MRRGYAIMWFQRFDRKEQATAFWFFVMTGTAAAIVLLAVPLLI
jgi:hypothetical protein